jgi:hypothetical protein
MGFKDMVATKDHSEILKMMEHIVDIQKNNSSLNWNDRGGYIKTSTYSDSIIIYSKDDSYESMGNTICTVAGVVQDLLGAGIPFKGALSVGTMTCDFNKSIYFGQPLIDAHLLQEELYFYGVVLHGSAEKELEAHSYSSFISEYKCPFKKGRPKHSVIQPIFFAAEDPDDVERNNNLLRSVENMKFSTSGSLRVYIDSTIEFLNHVRSNEI